MKDEIMELKKKIKRVSDDDLDEVLNALSDKELKKVYTSVLLDKIKILKGEIESTPSQIKRMELMEDRRMAFEKSQYD